MAPRPNPVPTIRVLLTFLMGCLLTMGAHAQRLAPNSIDSIDAKVLNADRIVIGTVRSTLGDFRTFEPSVAIRVDETLRGEAVLEIKGELRVAARKLEVWRQREVPLLIFASAGEDRLEAIDLETASDSGLFAGPYSMRRQVGSRIPVSTKDFRILTDRDEILRYVRAVMERHPGVSQIGRLEIDPPPDALGRHWTQAVGSLRPRGLAVPVDEDLERRGFEVLDRQNPRQMYRATPMLLPFPSERNIARLKRLLKDERFYVATGAEDGRGIESRDYAARIVAMNLLREWEVDFEKPVVRDRVSKRATVVSISTFVEPGEPNFDWLDEAKRLKRLKIQFGELSDDQVATIGRQTRLTDLMVTRTKLTDARLQRLAGLKNLRTLNLDANPITDAGLRVLEGMTSLKEVSLSETGVTEAGMAALRRARPGLRVMTGP